MSLRRFAQTNGATSASPTTPSSNIAPANTYLSKNGTPPSTPRNRISMGVYRSPASTPSISSSIPFDWNAARSRQPPPYGMPLQNKGRKSQGVGNSITGTPLKKVVRKRGIMERVTSIPSTIAFEIALFPHNVPLPSSKTSGWVFGAIMHFLHMCVRVSQVRQVPDSDLGWEDMYREGEGDSWFDWTVPVSIFLVGASLLNAIRLFTRTKLYRLHHQPEPVSSPNTRFVAAQLDFEPLKLPSLGSHIRSATWTAFSYSWRFLLGYQLSARAGQLPGKTSRVQQLEMWTPGQFEVTLFTIYSPAHAFLWMAIGSSNWMMMIVVMGLIGAQLNVMSYSYHVLLKDKEIISAEVMHEYNQGFVYPRMNPIRKDVAVMTHQSEVVNVVDIM